LSTNWNKSTDARETIIMIEEWNIELDGALYLLSCKFCANEIFDTSIAK